MTGDTEACASAAGTGGSEKVNELRVFGNEAFKREEWSNAVDAYTQALDVLHACPDFSGTSSQTASKLLCNRSNARFRIGQTELALDDAAAAVKHDPCFVKAYHRCAESCVKLGLLEDALEWYSQGIQRNPQQSTWLSKQVKKLKGTALTTTQKNKTKTTKMKTKSGFLGGSSKGLYDDVTSNPAKTKADRVLLDLQAAIRASSSKSQPGANDENNILADGMFQKLLDPKEFRRTAYKTEELPDNSKLPRTFQALLESPEISRNLPDIVARAQKKADAVLEGAKRRGAKEGQVMDSNTESMLRPQILREAIARVMVEDNQKQQREAIVSVAQHTASSLDPMARWDQLSPTSVSSLNKNNYAIQDSFMDDQRDKDWLPLLREEAQRAFRTGGGGMVAPGLRNGKSLHMPLSMSAGKYPAIHEVSVRLSALAHELNLKMGRKLAGNVTQSAILTVVHGSQDKEERSGYTRRLDGGYKQVSKTAGAGGKQRAVDVQVTCVYTFNSGKPWEEEKMCVGGEHEGKLKATVVKPAGALRLYPGTSRIIETKNKKKEEGEEEEMYVDVAPTHDRLVLFDSTKVENEMLDIPGPETERFTYLSISMYHLGVAE